MDNEPIPTRPRGKILGQNSRSARYVTAFLKAITKSGDDAPRSRGGARQIGVM